MKKNFFFLLLLLIVVFLLNSSKAQWQPDVRLTNDPGISYKSHNVGSVAATGDTVHVVWFDNRDANFEVYYKRSTNSGINWGIDTRLTNNSAGSHYSRLSVSGLVVHVVWYDTRDGNEEIYYKRSTDGGVSWGSDTRLTNNSAISYIPSLSTSGLVVHIVWYDNRDGNFEIYYKRSTDGGISWGTDTRLTNNSANSNYPIISVSDLALRVVWYDNRDGNDEIYYKHSTDGGVNWGSDTRLTNNSNSSRLPSISVSGSIVLVVWEDNRDGNYEIYFKLSTDGGSSWGTDTRLTNNTDASRFPCVSIMGSSLALNVHVVWMDYRHGNFEIYYKRSTDGGSSWGTDTRLTNNPANKEGPSVSVSGSAVHVVWFDNRDGNYEIYYKRDLTGNPVPPSAPSNLTATAVSSSRIDLNWLDNSYNESGFKIERSTNAGTNWILRDSVSANAVTYADLGLIANTIYHYRIFAYNALGNSPYSNIAFDTTWVNAPSAPTLLSPSNGATGQSLTPTLDWTDVSGATSYSVQVSIHNNFDTLVVNQTGLGSSQYTVPNNTLSNQTWYYWRANAANAGGTSPWSSVWNFQTLFVGINTYSSEVPKEFKLHYNFPNPFNPETQIRFDIPKTTKVKIILYDLLGRETKTLYDNIINPGKYEIKWDASDYPSGMYFYKLITDNFTDTKKMVLVK